MTHKSEMMVYKEQLDQEAAGVTALQQQIRENEQLIKNYKQMIKEVIYCTFFFTELINDVILWYA